MKISSIILSTVLSTLILFGSLRVTFTYVYYELDPIGFIERLCENKDKPELQCNGKCHLKKVAESSNNSQQEPSKYTSFKEIILFVVEKFKMNFISINRTGDIHSFYNNLYTFSGEYQIDHPPQA